MRLQGEIALITGAGQGIGRAVALSLAREGAAVALVDRNPEPLLETAQAIAQLGGRVWQKVADISDAAQIRSFVTEAHAFFDGLTILVNNAGVMATGTVETCTEAEWDRTLTINLRGTFLSCQAAIPLMKQRGYGRIINLSSSVTKNAASPSGIAYVASKSAISGITRQIAYQVAPHGITCNAIAPGPVRTAMPLTAFPQAIVDQMPKACPVGRMGEPEDVARVITFLALRDSDWITGEIVDVNGGSVID